MKPYYEESKQDECKAKRFKKVCKQCKRNSIQCALRSMQCCSSTNENEIGKELHWRHDVQYNNGPQHDEIYRFMFEIFQSQSCITRIQCIFFRWLNEDSSSAYMICQIQDAFFSGINSFGW